MWAHTEHSNGLRGREHGISRWIGEPLPPGERSDRIALETFFNVCPKLAHEIVREQHLFDALHIVLQSLAETEVYIHLPTRRKLEE